MRNKPSAQRMSRKAQFFSLIGVIIIVFAIVIFNSWQRVVAQEQEFRVDRARTASLDNFADTFADIDIPQMLKTSSRLALVGRSSAGSMPVSFNDFEAIMKTGSDTSGTSYMSSAFSTDSQFNSVKQALPFAANEPMSFNYVLVSVRQDQAEFLTLGFDVSYSIAALGATWSANNIYYEVDIPVYGITHPMHLSTINSGWTVTSTSCLAQELFSAANACLFNFEPPILTP